MFETLVALTILMIVFAMVTSFFVQNSIAIISKQKIKAVEQMNVLFMKEDILENQEFEIPVGADIYIKKEISKYNNGLKQIKLTAYNKQEQKIITRMKIVQAEKGE